MNILAIKELAKKAVRSSVSGRRVVDAHALAEFLERVGWYASFESRLPIDQAGRPLPWYTYPAIHFLSERVSPTMEVFEYGSGNSTLWWSGRAAHVTSFEHDPSWYGLLKDRLPGNVSYHHVPLEQDGMYARSAPRCKKLFDVIVIDGRDRVNCALHAVPSLKVEGVIIWDNSDRDYYMPGFEHLHREGFKKLDFEGLGPVNIREWRTSIFYRDGNCFGL